MKRNGGLIGNKKIPNLAGATGVYDTFDIYNSRRDNIWPKVKKFVSCSPNSGTYNEGDSITFTITVDGYENGNTVYYSIVAVSGTINTSDFTDSATTGSFTVNASGVGGFTKSLILDSTSESTDSFKVEIRDGSTSGTIIGESGTFTITDPTFSISPSSSSFNEGSSVTWTVTTTNISNGTTLYYSYSGTPANSGDITSSLTGSFTINSNSGSFTTTAANDFTTEGNETLTAFVRIGSSGGTAVASNSVTINDTSLTPQATVGVGTTNINENSSVTFTVDTVNYQSGTLYYTVENVSNFESNDLYTSVVSTAGTVGVSTNRITGINTSGISIGQVVVGPSTILSPVTTVTSVGISSVGIGTTTLNIGTQTGVGFTFGQYVSSGSISIASSTGSFSLTATPDGYTEGPEKFRVHIRFPNTSGSILTTSSAVEINDTTTGSTEPLAVLTDYAAITSTSALAFSYFPVISGPRTLLNWVSSYGITGSSSNTASTSWNNSFSGAITATATPITTNNYFDSGTLKLIQGDGTADGLDWVVFYFKGPLGDFDGYSNSSGAAWFGGESSYSGSSNGNTVTVGRIWGWNSTVGWTLLYQMPLAGDSTYNHTNGNYFTSGGTVSSGNGKRSDYDNLNIEYVGFSVS